MSNKKDFSSAEAAKISVEVTVQKSEALSDLLEENSEQFDDYIANLAVVNQRNSKLVCLLC